MYEYDDYMFVPTVKVNDKTVSVQLPYRDYPTALDAAKGIVDSEAVSGDCVNVFITLAGVNYTDKGNVSTMTGLAILYINKMYI